MNEHEVAWAAGLFEGEGSVYAEDQNGRRYLRFCLTSTDEDVIQRFARIVGVGKVYGPYAGTNKPRYDWRTMKAADGSAAAVLLAPWLGQRRRMQLGGFYEIGLAAPNLGGSPHEIRNVGEAKAHSTAGCARDGDEDSLATYDRYADKPAHSGWQGEPGKEHEIGVPVDCHASQLPAKVLANGWTVGGKSAIVSEARHGARGIAASRVGSTSVAPTWWPRLKARPERWRNWQDPRSGRVLFEAFASVFCDCPLSVRHPVDAQRPVDDRRKFSYDEAKNLRRAGVSMRDIGRLLGVTHSAVVKALQGHP